MTELINGLFDAIIQAIGKRAAHDKIEERAAILAARAEVDAKAKEAFKE